MGSAVDTYGWTIFIVLSALAILVLCRIRQSPWSVYRIHEVAKHAEVSLEVVAGLARVHWGRG